MILKKHNHVTEKSITKGFRQNAEEEKISILGKNKHVTKGRKLQQHSKFQ
jgi:hypothetical protein